MTIEQTAVDLGLKLLAGDSGKDNEVTGCYIGDLLSWVMSKAKQGDIWLTVMGNVNAVAVAALTDAAAILLTENAALDEEARIKADAQGIPVYTCSENSYEMAIKLNGMYNL